jgi:hypothetical protein
VRNSHAASVHTAKFDSGQPGADCLTPQLHTNGHLAKDHERNLPKSIAVSQGMPSAAAREDSGWRAKVILRRPLR